MAFNLSKCDVLHFGKFNVMKKLNVSGKTFNSISIQRDFGVQVHKLP